MKITPTSLTLNQLFGSANEQFVIPAYQRRYSWREQQLYELIEDIELLENTDVHLLGSIVCLTGHHTAGINRLELVDGQQRLSAGSFEELDKVSEPGMPRAVMRSLYAWWRSGLIAAEHAGSGRLRDFAVLEERVRTALPTGVLPPPDLVAAALERVVLRRQELRDDGDA
ncbi:DUF262 domain-containing protein [Mesorhizobium sp.]|uniref:DUF262 domain-containing protein n=1 Tax=Mesorhizobium sp. TaxID=1871066 RepID=UPI000FE7BE02|nr:DUF262 domain-containing protein [Mesorhizobium sp.]RWB25315.1 MAG: DUF262 domain-containing protein [Mesorhizobium sp.]